MVLQYKNSILIENMYEFCHIFNHMTEIRGKKNELRLCMYKNILTQSFGLLLFL